MVDDRAALPSAISAPARFCSTDRDEAREGQTALAVEHADAERRIRRLIAMLETDAGDVTSVLARVRELETARDRHEGCAHLTPEDTFDADYGRVLERAYAGTSGRRRDTT